jgi:hypothetical protein
MAFIDPHQPASAGLLLNDADDAPVPLPRTAAQSPTPRSAAPVAAPPAATSAHTANVVAALLDAAQFVSDPDPRIGIRRFVLLATGVHLGLSRRERDLRRVVCELYRATYHSLPGNQPER